MSFSALRAAYAGETAANSSWNDIGLASVVESMVPPFCATKRQRDGHVKKSENVALISWLIISPAEVKHHHTTNKSYDHDYTRISGQYCLRLAKWGQYNSDGCESNFRESDS